VEAFRAFVTGPYQTAKIDFENKSWHTDAGIKDVPGWYFVTTNAPVSVLAAQTLWDTTYIQKQNKKKASVKNYNLAVRAGRHTDDLARFWNTTIVYSGMASSLRNRAREHTFGDPGTGGLALYRYPALADYNWTFSFLRLDAHFEHCDDTATILKLGEQMWRSANGWPLLCAE
jgi:hypothetical protein